MDDLAPRLRHALDQVDPVTLADVAAARRRRFRRRWVARSAVAATVVAAVALVVSLLSRPATTTVTTPPGPIGTPATGGPTVTTVPASVASNPLFSPIGSVEVPGPTVGLVEADGALYTWTGANRSDPNTLTRIDPRRYRVTAQVDVHVAGVAYAGGRLWASWYSTPSTGAPDEVLAFDPLTLAVVGRIPIPHPAASASGRDSIAAAGGLIWVVGGDSVYGIDPGTATVVRHLTPPAPPPVGGYQFGPGDYEVDIAAPTDGRALWTAETPGGGGSIALQVRNPSSGAVVHSGTGSVGVGEAQIAPSDTYAWIVSPTGNSGGYTQVRNQPGLPAAATNPPPGGGGTNAISVALAAGRLWIYDPESERIDCADPLTGRIIQAAHLGVAAISPMAGGQIAVLAESPTSATATIAVAVPSPACRA